MTRTIRISIVLAVDEDCGYKQVIETVIARDPRYQIHGVINIEI